MIEIVHDPQLSRCVQATSSMGENTKILTVLPYCAVVCEMWSREVCWFCFHLDYGKRCRIRCSVASSSSSSKAGCSCRVVYCSEKCAKEDADLHQWSCRYLSALEDALRRAKRLDEEPFDHEERDLLRLVVLVLSRRQSDHANVHGQEKEVDMARFLDPEPTEPKWWDLMVLQDNRELVLNSQDDKRCSLFHQMWEFLRFSVNLPTEFIGVDDTLVCAVLYRELANSFGIWDNTRNGEVCDSSDLLGYGVYPKGAIFNHSCSPNVQKKHKDRAIEFWTSTSVNGGDQLFISYGNVTEPVDVRRERMLQNYFFQCHCARCRHELSLR
jgi:hypothetical protein